MLRSLFVVVFLCATTVAQPPDKNGWAEWGPFLGAWQGSGGGGPGHGVGEFNFATELQGAVMIRHNYAEYPATNGKPSFRHDDLVVIYHDTENKTRADYWDSEGHIIHYDVALSADKLVFLSDVGAPGPRYRLTYVKTDANTLKITFEIAPPNSLNGTRVK